MSRHAGIKLFLCSLALAVTGSAASQSPPLSQQPIQEPRSDVIVILRDQLANVPPARRATGARTAAVAASQASALSQLQQAGPRAIHSFSTINAFATKVSSAEAAQLTARPDVLAVVPDRTIRARRNPRAASSSIPGTIRAPAPQQKAAASQSLCSTLEPQALELTNTAFLDPTIPQAQQVLDGNGQTVTGKGVKVAFIADGLDPRVLGFTHTDGSSVFFDYQNFNGDPAGTFTPGGEAFGDASSIAANDTPNGVPLLFDISQFVNAAHPLPSPCNIRIRGMAPDASLAGLNVFSVLGFTTTSNFVQAIEWAVIHDDVDVINESFGGNPFPDNDNDPISLADAAAIKAGVTVVVSTGDAGTAGTLGSPSTDNGVIAAGASTQYRIYAQTGDGVFPLSKKGIVNNNITPFNSAGFAQLNARTVDVVAPGDSGWALCSTDPGMFTDCVSFNGGSTPVEDFGGTSESSPLTAGEAALVIQAYRSSHHGASPSPVLVKQIIMSTATDLGAPAFEQGAGLINSLAAVNTALSVDDANGHPKGHGAGVVTSPSSLLLAAAPGASQTHSFTMTNTGTSRIQASTALLTLGAPFAGANISVELNPTKLPTFQNVVGTKRPFLKKTFSVPAGADHLDASIAYQTVANPTSATDQPVVLLALLDPSGNQVTDSVAQGANSGYGHADVVHPVAGTWTAIIWTHEPQSGGSYTGPVQFSWSVENYVKLGTVSPAQINLAPGASATLVAEFAMPAAPGDSSAAIRFFAPAGGAGTLAEIPFSLRTLIPLGSTGGNFTGTLTGGNGRPGAGPTQTFAFDVPNGVHDMSLTLQIADSGYLLQGLLVDPNGMQLSVEPNLDPNGNPQNGLQLFRGNPQPGRWRFVLLQNFSISGNQTSLEFIARIGFNGARVTATGLPDSAGIKLAAGKPVNVPIQVVNTGSVTSLFFADARLNKWINQPLALQNTPSCPSPPLTLPSTCGIFVVPTQANSVQFAAKSNVQITMDVSNQVGSGVGITGNPDLYARQITPGHIVASLSEPEIPFGSWLAFPSLVGPYGPAGAFTAPVTLTASATIRAFDDAVASDSGDIWADITLGTGSFSPLVLGSNETGVINVTITPDTANIGRTVSGFIYIDTFNPNVGTGDEVVRLPYTYTVTR